MPLMYTYALATVDPGLALSQLVEPPNLLGLGCLRSFSAITAKSCRALTLGTRESEVKIANQR